ncbi:hypothetical protein B0H16DRAFT_1726617 [Mycena metata]|uniref:Uncharacterized protein n=1 Tax=Mycena metata TaxID=1033252 RepID=A0AAD7N4C7_9AGAR|nr:hypothetical protein B0H16DRAFT_1726617 [Mycena metata]
MSALADLATIICHAEKTATAAQTDAEQRTHNIAFPVSSSAGKLTTSYTGLSPYSCQTICNVIGIITGTIAAGLHGNIGLKVIYRLIVETLFKGPGLMIPRGRIAWSCLVLVYWSAAFVLASAILSVGALTGLLAAMASSTSVCVQYSVLCAVETPSLRSCTPCLMLGLDLTYAPLHHLIRKDVNHAGYALHNKNYQLERAGADQKG